MARELKNLLVNRLVERALESVAPRAGGRMIEIGCGEKPYEQMFSRYVTEHVGVDHPDSIHDLGRVDILGSAYALPVPDGSFDTVLCTSVLEHLEEPAAALREARRVVADGALAIYTVPFIWHIHEEPRDFFRYSEYGLRYLFEQSGFEIDEIRPLSGFWVTFGQLLVYYLYRRSDRRAFKIAIAPVGLAIQLCSFLLDKVDRAEKWTWMYLVVARARPAV